MTKKGEQQPDVSVSPEAGNQNPDVSVPKKAGRPRKKDNVKSPEKKSKKADVNVSERAKSPSDQEPEKDAKKKKPKESAELKEARTTNEEKSVLEKLDPFRPMEIGKITEEDKEQLLALAQHTDYRLRDKTVLLGHARKIRTDQEGQDHHFGIPIYYSQEDKDAVMKGEKKPEDIPEPEDLPGGNLPIEIQKRKEKAEKEKAISEEAFNEESRKRWVEIAIHGMLNNGKLEPRSDLDGNSYLKLLQLAGIRFDPSKVDYVPQGEYKEGALTGDTGNIHGIKSFEEGKTTVVDHHGKESGRDTSATKNIYKLLVQSGLLKQEEYLDKFVQFVTDEDNKNYTDEQFEYLYKNKNYPKTIIGLANCLTPDQLIDFFKAGHNRFQILPDSFLEKVTGVNSVNGQKINLLSASNNQKENLEKSIQALQEIEKEGFAVDTGSDRFGKVAIDTGKETGQKIVDGTTEKKYALRVPMGFDLARTMGYDGLIKYTPYRNSFRIYTKKPLIDLGITFDQGFSVRGAYWNKPENDPSPLIVGIKEILEKLADDKIVPAGKLKEYIEKEDTELVAKRGKRRRESMEFTDKESASLFNWAEYARDRIDEIENDVRQKYKNQGMTDDEISKKIKDETDIFWKTEMFQVIAECLSDYPDNFTMREELIPDAIERINKFLFRSNGKTAND